MMYQKNRTKIGQWMYSLTVTWGKWLSKHMWLWYILNLTWGILFTLMGAFLALCLLLTGHKPYKYKHVWCFEFGDNWGGLEGAFFIFVAKNMGDWTQHIKEHEFGHSFQNTLYGPFNIILTYLPSVIRYWYQVIREKKGLPNKEYDLAWFEESATDIGHNFEINNYK
jgi:hypothetical protein